MKKKPPLILLLNFWPKLRETDFARRRAYDWRAALLLIQQGVTDFATVNEKDFRDCGFQRVWNPLAAIGA